MLRRLEKRILVGLPTTEARRVMFMHHLPAIICTTDSNGFDLTSDLDYEALAKVPVCPICSAGFRVGGQARRHMRGYG